MRATLFVAFALVTAQTCHAQVCPMYLSGQWNGIYYYYSLPKPASATQPCDGSHPSLGTASAPKSCGCSAGCDAITVKAATGLVTVSNVDDDAYLKKHTKKKKSGGEPGQGPDTEPDFTFLRGPGNVTISGDGKFYKAKSDMDGDFYFRVLTITHTPATGDPLVFHIGHEIDTSGGAPAAADVDDTWDFDGAATGTGTAAGKQHVLKNKSAAITKKISCLSYKKRR